MEDRLQPSPSGGTSAIGEFVRSLGTDVDNPEVLRTLREVLEFSLSANERDRHSLVVPVGPERQMRLTWRDVAHGVVIVYLLEPGLEQDLNPIVRLQATKCLADLAESPRYQVKMASHSAVLDVLVGQLQKAYSALGREQTILADVLLKQIHKVYCSSLQEHTARCLANLAQKEENHLKMACSSVLDPLLKLLESDAQPQVHRQAARCLTNLAASTQNKERIGNYPGVLAALAVLLCNYASSGVHEQIINCLTNLASSQKIQIKIVSGYPAVLNALGHFLGEKGNTAVQQESLKCLIALSDHYQSTQVDIASHPGILDALLRLLRTNWITTDRIKVQVEAIRFLLKLLSAPENLLKIGSHDSALHVLVICLDPSRRNREVRSLAVECLSSLAAAPENQVNMVKFPRLVSALVNHLETVHKSDEDDEPPWDIEESDGQDGGQEDETTEAEISEGQELAAWCLSKLAVAKESKRLLTFCRGLLRSLVTVLKRPVNRSNPALMEPALNCLVNLAQSDEFSVRTRITNHPGVIDDLVTLLGSNLDGNLLELAAQCLSDLALSPLNAKKIADHPEVLESLVKLLLYTVNSGVREYTAKCLNNLACFEESQIKMASYPGMLNALVLSLGSKIEVTQSARQGIHEHVVKCLAQLSEPEESRSKIAEFPGMHDALRRMVADNGQPKSQIRQAALQCLENLKLSSVAAREPKNNRYESAGSLHLQSSSGREFDESISDPDHWSVDPITYETMSDPIKCNDGVTYDRWTIINHGIRKSPYDRSLSNFSIAFDDVDVRRRLFRKFPEQEVRFRLLRENYREKALQSARALNFEDAIEMLNNVLMWASSDTECRTELDKILSLVNEQPSTPSTPSENSSLVYPESPHLNHEDYFETDGDRSSVSGPLVEEDRTPGTPVLTRRPQDVLIEREIPRLSHDDLMAAREQEFGGTALIYILISFGLFFACFITI